MRARCCTALLCLALAALPAAAEQARKFGVLSLIGDGFLIVDHEGAKGDQPAVARKTVLDLPEHVFDDAVSVDVREAIREAAPGTDAVNLSGAKALYAREGESVDDPRPILARVQAAVTSAGITHLVLLTKLRRRADVPLDPKEAELQLEGLGLYVDPAVPSGDRNNPVTGFLASFAYFRVWLVDVGRQRVLGYREVAEISPVMRRSSTTAEVWASLSSAEKVRMVRLLVREGAQPAVRELIGNMPDQLP